MKIKSRLILAASSLLVLSGVAAGTSTYAWYTANRQVELGISNISATAQLTTLSMTYENDQNVRNYGTDAVDSFTLDESTAESAVVGSFSKKLTDVSSKGDGSYLKPIFAPNVDDGDVGFWESEAEYRASPNADEDVFYHQIVFTFKTKGTETSVLYLSPNSTVTENVSGDDDDLEVANAVRFSISTVAEATVPVNTVEKIYANPNGNSEAKYLADTTGTTAVDVPTTGTYGILEKSTFFDNVDNFTEADMYYGAGDSTKKLYNAKDTGYITEVSPSTEFTNFYVAVDVWIEGTDADCIENISDEDYYGLFDLNLEFYSLNKGSMTNTGTGE